MSNREPQMQHRDLLLEAVPCASAAGAPNQEPSAGDALNQQVAKYCPWIVIPVYRHAAALEQFISELLQFDIPLIIVDDGNSEEDSLRIAALARSSQQSQTKSLDAKPHPSPNTSPEIVVLRHAKNLGKGAAVLTALREAIARGATHLIQIDADGQHAAADIPRFVAFSQAQPETLLLGVPVFDHSAPKSRVWGRKLTTAMIALQSWSVAVGDGLLGFRLYPIAALQEVALHHRIEPRMGFDVEILLQLLWRGIRVANIPTMVKYPKDGISNFRYLEDNLTLIRLHTQLLLLGLYRAPLGHLRRLFGRQPNTIDRTNPSFALSSTAGNKWYEKQERGNKFALKLVLRLYALGGRPLLDILLYPVILYFFCTDPDARRHSRDYLRRLKQFDPDAPVPAFAAGFWHLHRFGQKIISSLQAWLGEFRGEEIEWQGKEAVFDLIDQGQGGVVISAHLGCLEVCRATHRDRNGLRITPLMYFQNAKIFRSFLAEINPESACTVLAIEQLHAGVALEIQQRIQQGEFFAILADRRAPQSPGRSLTVKFLGEQAQLPEGAFALAMALECPVFTFFTIYNEETKRYQAFWQELPVTRPSNRTARREQLQTLADEYARRLEAMCRKAPLQWFNYFDFWDE